MDIFHRALAKALLGLLLICAMSVQGQASTFTLGNKNAYQNGGGGANAGVTLTVGAGHLLIVFVDWDGVSKTITSCSGNSNTYTRASGPASLPDQHTNSIDAFYVLAANSGSTTIVCTWTPSTPTFVGYYAYEFSYSGTASFDKVTASNGTGASTSSTLTTASNNEVIGSIMQNGAATVAVLPSGFTDSQASFIESAIEADAGTAGSNSITWGLSFSDSYHQVNMAFSATGGGGGGGGGTTAAQKARGFFHLP